jgi:hypothetical protein
MPCPTILAGHAYNPVTIRLHVDFNNSVATPDVRTYHCHMSKLTETQITVLPLDRCFDCVWYTNAVHYTIDLASLAEPVEYHLPRYVPTSDADGQIIHAVPPAPQCAYEVRLPGELEHHPPALVDVRFQEWVVMTTAFENTVDHSAAAPAVPARKKKMWKRPKYVAEAAPQHLPADLADTVDSLVQASLLCPNFRSRFDQVTGEFEHLAALCEQGLYRYVLGPNNCEAKHITRDMVKHDGHTLVVRVVARALPFVWRFFEMRSYMLRSPVMTRQAIGIFFDTPSLLREKVCFICRNV